MAGINVLPGVYYNEKVQKNILRSGGEIPCFIGKTNNDNADGTKITKYTNFNDVSKSVEEGGIGATGNVEEDIKNNPLEQVLKDFFDEINPNTYNIDVGVPYIYIIDVGTGEDLTTWIGAIKNCKIYRDISIEVYVGLEYLKSDMQTAINISWDYIKEQAKKLDLRRIFFTIQDKLSNLSADDEEVITDEDLIELAQANIQYNRLNLTEPLLFGKTIGRFCVTPIGEEAGYYVYNTVKAGTFKDRTPEQRLKLQQAGVIFNADEYSSSTYYPKINLGVATCFGNTVDNRPADSLDSSRRIADYILEQVFDACYPQIKARETRTQIAMLQTKINTIVNKAIDDSLVVGYNEITNPYGTVLIVEESDSNPYSMIVTGNIQPVNCTIAIEVEATITQPAMKATEEA